MKQTAMIQAHIAKIFGKGNVMWQTATEVFQNISINKVKSGQPCSRLELRLTQWRNNCKIFRILYAKWLKSSLLPVQARNPQLQNTPSPTLIFSLPRKPASHRYFTARLYCGQG
jgi:hypothetical protein